MKLYAIAAGSQHGKQVCFDVLKDICPATAQLSFAAPLKQDLADAFGDEFPELFSLEVQNAPDRPKITRKIQQWYGTEVRRAADVNYWIHRMSTSIVAAACSGASPLVITDLRFPNEAAYVRSVGGRIVGVERLVDGQPYRHPGTDYGHQSEIHIPEIVANADFKLVNDSDRTSFERLCDDFWISQLKGN